MNIPPSVETLARAMCAALEIDPDKHFAHGYDYDPYPRIVRETGGASLDVLLRSPSWHKFAWQAHKWIWEHSAGELPPPDREWLHEHLKAPDRVSVRPIAKDTA